MEQFYFNVERRISTWVRELHSISAESKEDAIKHLRELDPLNPNLKNLK